MISGIKAIKIQFAILFIAAQLYNTPAIACFDNKSLEITQYGTDENVTRLLYVWSPRMVLSVTQAQLAADASEAAGLKFIPLVDGRIPIDEWQSALNVLAKTKPEVAKVLLNSEPLCSEKMRGKDAYAHFPTAFVQQNGQLHPNRLIGAMPTKFWIQGIKERLNTAGATQEITFQNVVFQTSNETNIQIKPPSVDESLGQCIPQNQFIALDTNLAGLDDNQQVALGAYERISPDGRFVLRSYSGKKLTAVSVVELPPPIIKANINKVRNFQKIYQTPLTNEAFPVQGSWRYMVDTNGEHYTFKSILTNTINAKPLFRAGMDGFYAAAAEVNPELSNQANQPVSIRSLSWPNPSGGGGTNDTEQQGIGMLTSRTISVEIDSHRLIADSGRVNLCLNRLGQDGMMYALPMISVDGKEFAALPQKPIDGLPTMRIYSFGNDGKQCEPKGQFTSQSGKIIFGYSSLLKKGADVAYEYRGQVWWVERNTGDPLEQLLPMNLAPWEDRNSAGNTKKPTFIDVTANAFPGFARDGRVIYAANWKRCIGSDKNKDCQQEGGYVVSDPYQSNAYRNWHLQNKSKPKKSCITEQEVLTQRATFAAFHGIAE